VTGKIIIPIPPVLGRNPLMYYRRMDPNLPARFLLETYPVWHPGAWFLAVLEYSCIHTVISIDK
jgi:hypothetical protein